MVDNLTKMTADVNVISKLDNYPPDDPGMTPSKLKELFDKGSNTIKDFINNTLTEEIDVYLDEENKRIAAEAARVIAEGDSGSGRVKAELDRVAAEEARETAEGLREEGEVNRNSQYVLAEAARDSLYDAAEAARNDLYSGAESARTSAFNLAEAARAAAEGDENSGRVKAELDRVAAENARASAEQARVNAENARSVFEVYNPGKSYVVGNKVYYLGSSYRCIKNSSGVAPTNTECWMIIARKGEVYFPTFSVDENMQLIMHDDFNYDGTISFRLNNGYLIQEVV